MAKMFLRSAVEASAKSPQSDGDENRMNTVTITSG
jgi:hypothetical protein